MNKTAIKNFAVWARNKLIADISYRAGLIGITESGIASALPQSTGTIEFYDIGTAEPYSISGDAVRQRRCLVELIERKEKETDYKTAYKYIIEEVAYTWFNRLIAIRFMEVNDYLPSHIRVLSSESGKMEPDIVTTPFDADFSFSDEEEKLIVLLKDKNELDELFRLLFIKQCNELNKVLPKLFEQTSDYSELLLNISVVDKDGVVYHLINDIPEEDFNIEVGGQIEIIGWLYQFYNIEPKAEVFGKKTGKISKDEIPAATQLFTPDWIVKYLVENSLGRFWVERHPESELKGNWKYFLEESKQSETNAERLRKDFENDNIGLENIRIIDPCMGSGHMLVYCFDVLVQMYEAQGYSKRDAAQLIVNNNLFGLDIDKRATQLAYFAVMMKARQHDRRIFSRELAPNIHSIEESNEINRNQLEYLGLNMPVQDRNKAISDIYSLLETFIDAKEYGSIISVENYDWELLYVFITDYETNGQISFETVGIEETQIHLLKLLDLAKVMAQKYHVTVTNPPYMAISAVGNKLNSYVKKKYPDCKEDLYLVFMERCNHMCVPNGFQAMITQHSWMFLSRSENVRRKMQRLSIVNMAHLGARAFEEIGGEVVQTTAFVCRNAHMDGYIGRYKRLVDPTTQDGKEVLYFETEAYEINQDKFSIIPGSPVVYWISDSFIENFKAESFGDVVDCRVGLDSGNNDFFLKYWFEVDYSKIDFNSNAVEELHSNRKKKFVPHTKGGEYRKWYGNYEYVIAFDETNYNLLLESGNHLPSRQFYFKEGLNWTRVSSKFAVRYTPKGMVFNSACPTVFCDKKWLYYSLALLNSKVSGYYLDLLSPTINFQAGDVNKVPYIKSVEKLDEIDLLVENILQISKSDWDSFETSWDFNKHPLVNWAEGLWDVTATGAAMYYYYNCYPEVSSPLELCYMLWSGESKKRFDNLKNAEESINNIFISMYGVNQEVVEQIDEKEVTVRTADLNRDIRSFISYAVGCILGRYSLDVPGIVFAGGQWNDEKYSTFIPDKDNCIPITDEEYFDDDVVGLFCAWLKKVFGENSLEANLDFIAKALGGKGATSRDVLRNYFVNDFMKDHMKIYQKRPIYWLFDSGKQNGFKALVYMHRWNADTIGNLRVEYLHRAERIYESEINRMQDMIDHSTNAREVAAATKRKEKLQKQLKECREYDEKIGHLALSRIDIDLDDGVKVNYEKVQTASDGKKYQVLAKI